MTQILGFLLGCSMMFAATTARAEDDSAAFWFNPSFAVDLDDDTSVEVESSLRLQTAANGADTYLLRFWLVQQLADNVEVSGAIERRINFGARDELFLIQQASAKSGVLRARLRLDQRFVDGADQAALRVRPRLGVNVAIDKDRQWRAIADVEAFFTLQPGRIGGATGLTALRTRLGGTNQLSQRWQAGLFYQRTQDIRPGRVDRVTHVPMLTIEYMF